jgi:hypothetical protein
LVADQYRKAGVCGFSLLRFRGRIRMTSWVAPPYVPPALPPLMHTFAYTFEKYAGEPKLSLAQKLAAFDPDWHGGEVMPITT